MDIKYLGHSSFQIKTKDSTVVIDPYDTKTVGMKYPKVDADIVTVSHQHGDHNAVAAVGGSPLVIDWPGEYEKKGVRITGYQTFHDKNKGADRGENIMFKIEADGISILHCGDLGLVPDQNFIEDIGEVNILMVPIGGFYTIDPQEAVEVVRKVEPSIVIPMHYNHEKLDQQTFNKLATVHDFVQKIGATPETSTKLTAKKEDFQVEGMKVVVMEITS
jgi:L-ascorbate metabolism protein UlaG (beta-lactamase superfamily)